MVMLKLLNNKIIKEILPLPQNADLIKWDDTESELIRPFEDMERDGKDFMKNVYNYAKDKIKALNKQRELERTKAHIVKG